jgi:hypothetical protein
LGLAIDHLDSDVVFASCVIGCFDELLTDNLGAGLFAQQQQDVLFIDHPHQAIRTQQNAIPFLQRDRLRLTFDIDIGILPKHPRNDIGAGVVFGFFFFDFAFVNQPMDTRLIAREAHQYTIPQQIHATVSDMGDVSPPFVTQNSHDSRAHFVHFGVGLRRLPNLSIGPSHGFL